MLTVSFPIITIPILVTVVCVLFAVFRERVPINDFLSAFLFGFIEYLVDLATAIPPLISWTVYFAYLAFSRQ